MPILKQASGSKPYTLIDNETFLSIVSVSTDAAAIWVYLRTKPEDWIVRRSELMASLKIGSKDRYYKAIDVLRQFGVWATATERADNGRYNQRVIYIGDVLDAACDALVLNSGTKATVVPVSGTPVYRDSGKSGPLVNKDSLVSKDSTKGRKSRDIPLHEFLTDRSWAGGDHVSD